MKNRISLAWLPIVFVAGAIGAAGCAKVQQNPSTDGTGGTRGTGGNGGVILPPVGLCQGQCKDFPATPIMDPSAPANAAAMFSGTAPASGGPCVVEPEDDTLFPNNWLRPRVKFTGAGGKLVKITMEAANQANVLAAYTMLDTWVLPLGIWGALRGHQITDAVTVTVWVQGGGASRVKFHTAPVGAGGNLIFWAANPLQVDLDPHMCWPPNGSLANCANGSKLLGFSVGDESTIPVLQIAQVTQGSRTDSGAPSHVICVGCHSGMPDSGYVTFVDHYPWRAATGSVQAGTSGAFYPSQTPGGLAALQLPGWGPFTYNKSIWAPGMRIGVAALGLATPLTIDYSDGPDKNRTPSLAWVNLESPMPGVVMGNWTTPSYAPGADITSGNSVGIIARTGDSAGVAFPNWSHDGKTILYASTVGGKSARLDIGKTDLYTVPFNNGLGGTATPVNGAAAADTEEYYPAYSPDDQLIAFTRVPAGQVMYGNPNAELSVIPAAGGKPIPLRANKPPACTGKTSPGVNNHWPKWSPDAVAGYYWIIFSSNRADIPPVRSLNGPMRSIQISQLYMAPVVIDGENGIATYPAIYLWNQPTDSVNTTPAWETFTIPPIE